MIKNENNKDWKISEQLVTALERYTSPNSKVEHNVFLPVIGRKERKPRQFDVVITTHINEYKKHVAVVEVQKRNSKPTIGTFHSWIRKMEEVGAQQLICVSVKGFPKSVFDEVKNKYGENTVALMTLKEMDKLLNPENVNLDFTFSIQNKNWLIEDMTEPCLEYSAQKYMPLVFNKDKKIFVIDESGTKINFKELCEEITSTETNKPEVKERLKIQNSFKIFVDFKNSQDIFVSINDEKFKIDNWTFTIAVKVTPITFESETRKFEYRHEILNNAIAWISSTTAKFEGKSIQINFILKMENGELKFTIEDKLL